MRVIYCVFLLLTGCASHTVRCDGRLQPINLPAPTAVTGAAASAVPGATATAAAVQAPPRSPQ